MSVPDRSDRVRLQTGRMLVDAALVRAPKSTHAFLLEAGAHKQGPYEELVAVAHPIVRAHPVTGLPALYFDLDRATHIEGQPEADGRALLQQLQDHAEATAPRYAHGWRPYDVLIWDNAAVQHKASADFPVGEPRRFWRYMIEGTTPTAYADRPTAPPLTLIETMRRGLT